MTNKKNKAILFAILIFASKITFSQCENKEIKLDNDINIQFINKIESQLKNRSIHFEDLELNNLNIIDYLPNITSQLNEINIDRQNFNEENTIHKIEPKIDTKFIFNKKEYSKKGNSEFLIYDNLEINYNDIFFKNVKCFSIYENFTTNDAFKNWNFDNKRYIFIDKTNNEVIADFSIFNLNVNKLSNIFVTSFLSNTFSKLSKLSKKSKTIITEKNIRIFPNPASNQLTIYNDIEFNDVIIKLFDINGNVVKKMQILGHTKNINLDLSNLQNGIYNLNLIDNNNSIFSTNINILK